MTTFLYGRAKTGLEFLFRTMLSVVTRINGVSESERARLIEVLTHDKSQKIGDLVKSQFLKNANGAGVPALPGQSRLF